MLKNLNTFKLLIILVVLVLIYLGFQFFGGKTRSKGFHEELVTIDTAQVDKLTIEKGGNTLELKKEDNDWWVKLKDGKFVKATESSVKNTMETLLSIKPSRIVTRSKDKWKEFQVDTAGTNVKAFENGKNTLDLIIGKLNFKDQRSYYTYVRLAGEENTYVADNFMAFSINTNSDGYRNSKLLRLKKDSLTAVEFNYPDSSFILEKEGDIWSINGTPTDSAATVKFLNGLNYVNGSGFYDEELPSSEPQVSVTFKRKSEDDIAVKCWLSGNEEKIIQSSENEDNNFTGKDVFDKVFVSKSTFYETDN